MLLDPQCTCLITNSQHLSQTDFDKPVSANYFVWSFLTKTMQDQALPSHVNGKICPRSTQFWLRFWASAALFLDTRKVHNVYHH